MSRTIFCKKLKANLPGLSRPPYPGEIGIKIYDNISQKAWEEWTNQQTILLNENRMSLIDPATKKFLEQQMQNFLFGDDEDC